MRDVKRQLSDYWSEVTADHRLPGAAELIDRAEAGGAALVTALPGTRISDNGTTPPVDSVDEILVDLDRRPDPGGKTMTRQRWLIIGAAAAIVLIVGIVALAMQGDDSSDTDTVDEPDPAPETTVAPTTTAPPTTTESAAPPEPETTEVSLFLLDSAIPPEQFTCLSAPSNFEVDFVDEAGESTVVRAVTEAWFAPSIEDPPINTTCTDVAASFDGQPAILFSAVLDAPASDVYQSIAVKYVFSEEFATFFEDVPLAEAQAGLYLEFSDEADLEEPRVLTAEDIEALQLAE
jgi:hypothetical protein